MNGTGKIAVRRSQESTGILRRIRIQIDGQEAAALRPGQQVSLSAAVGAHSVQAFIDWCSSPPLVIDIRDDQVKTIEVAMPWTFLRTMIRNPSEALTLREVAG